MIQMLTHVLGSSDSVTWPNQHTPASQLAPSPFGPSYSSPAQTSSHANFALAASSRSPAGGGSERSKSELSALQPMIQALIARLGKDHQLPRRPVGEQDLTALLQTLMEQQQRQQEQQRTQREGSSNQAVGSYSASNYALGQQYPMAQVTSSRASKKPGQTQSTFAPVQSIAYQPLNFADLDFEDEDEDDPDFNPDLNPDLPLPSAWSLAVRDVVASEESRAAAAAAAAVASHSGTPSGNQTPATNGLLNDTYRASNPQPSDRSPMHTPRGTDTCRASLGEQTVQSSGRESLGGISNSDHASSAAPGRTVQADDRWSSSRHVVPQAPSFSTAREDTSSTLLLSPSGRPVRSSRKRQSSPISAPQARDARGGRREDTHQLLTGSQGFRDEGEYTGQSAHRATLNTARAGLSPSMRERSSTCFDATSASVPPQSQSQSQSGDTESSAPRKRGRKPVLEPGEAQRRRAQRNIEYQRMRRQAKKAEESEQGETVLELKAEVKMLRAEMERLRDENAMLRAQRELERLQRSDS
nr:putative protein [Melanopsichium pennsylvanicum 4]